MLTDGKINDNEWAVRLLVESTKYIRVFPVGIGANTNSHCIRCVPLCLVPLLPTMSLFMISNIFFLIDLLQRPVEVSQSSPDKEKTCEPVWSLYFLSSPLLPLFFHRKKNKLILQTVANLQVERSYRAAQSLGYTNVQVTWEADRTPAQVAPFSLPPLLHKERYS